MEAEARPSNRGHRLYGTIANIAAVERANIRAYVPLTGAGKARPYFSKEARRSSPTTPKKTSTAARPGR